MAAAEIGAQLLLLSVAKHALLSIICAASLLWLSWWLVSSEPMKDPKYFDRLQESSPSRFFRVDGKYGLVILYQAMPVFVVALLSFAVIELRRKIKSLQLSNEQLVAKDLQGPDQESSRRHAAYNSRPLRPSFVTYPLVVQTGWWNPFGVLTAAEALAIVGALFLVFYSYGRLTHLDFKELEERYQADPKLSLRTPLSLAKLNRGSENMGRAALIPFALLWIPVSRGSPLLRLLKVPFEHAVKYHIWLAVLALTLLTGHSVGYIVYYYQTESAYKILDWVTERERCSLVAGLVAWIAGLLMWATSLSYFRRRWYELFFSVHHLYVVFLLFWLYHVLYTIHFFMVPVLLFVIDRGLRMVQSRQSVDVLSAKVLESGAIQLRIAATNILDSTRAYHALSSWYLRFPSLSRLMKLQWHFFSVTSTPLDEKPELSIVIKPLGKWTSCLQKQLLQSAAETGSGSNGGGRCPFSFKAGIEGPYGDETDFFLRYNTLVLIGGGIGVTPLLAMLCDILHRQRRGRGISSLPTAIHLYHCVRTPEELCILNSIDPNEISPGYEKRGLRIRVSAFVTSSSLTDYNNMQMHQGSDTPTPALQETLDLATSSWSMRAASTHRISPVTVFPRAKKEHVIQSISSLSTTGKSTWVASVMLASMAGFYILWGLSNVYIVKHLRNNFPTNFTRAHIIIASMILGTTIFGGAIVLAWYWISSKKSLQNTSTISIDPRKVGIANASPCDHEPPTSQQLQAATTHMHSDEENVPPPSPWSGTLHLGARLVWSDVFNALDKEYHGQNIGVLVSGSEAMQADAARECQRHTRLFDTPSSSNVYHYHSVSFEL